MRRFPFRFFVAIVLAGCGGGDDPSAPATADATPSDTSGDSGAVDSLAPPTDAGVDSAPPDTGPSCTSSAECGTATIKVPSATAADSPTTCARAHCGLSTPDNRGGALGSKTPVTCNAICAASTYAGSPMVCSPLCRAAVINGFGDLGLFYDDGGDAGVPGSLGGLATYQFSTIAGAYRYAKIGCGDLPSSKIIEGSNSFKYNRQNCCCIAAK